jgi:hypothetical protein
LHHKDDCLARTFGTVRSVRAVTQGAFPLPWTSFSRRI